MARKKKKPAKKQVQTLTHDEATRTNIPTAELESVMRKGDQQPAAVSLERPGVAASAAMSDEFRDRNPDLDPQLVWRGKDTQGWSDLVTAAPPLFIQEKVHPKALIDDLRRQTEAADLAKKLAEGGAPPGEQIDLFADFNGIPDHSDAKTEFYQHDQHWSNRMILGDSLAVMASLAEREGLRGKVQCIYLDPPYGIKFNSNFQWSTTSRDVKDGNRGHITREPEQVKAFRDTWRDGIHSYLTYLRDRLTVARDLLHDTGSIFVQIGDENVHRVRAVMDEVFGPDSFRSEIKFKTTGGHSSEYVASIFDSILWFGKTSSTKFRRLYFERTPGDEGATQYKYGETPNGHRASLTRLEATGEEIAKVFQPYPMVSMGPSENDGPVLHEGQNFYPTRGRHWSVKTEGTQRIGLTGRLFPQGKNLRFVYYLDDYAVTPFTNIWNDTMTSGFSSDRTYVVQTLPRVIERCLLMATDPGDLVLDPTCGSGTTAYVAEQWGRRWITIDTSRVSLALARARIMGARYPFYLLADSPEGVEKEAQLTRTELPDDYRQRHYSGGVRQGFVYERVPHITLKSIANNAEIDVIHERYQAKLEPLREQLNAALGTSWEEWEVPRDWEQAVAASSVGWASRPSSGRSPESVDGGATKGDSALGRTTGETPIPPEAVAAQETYARWWKLRIARQGEIDASIAAKADSEYLYDKPYEDKKKVRVAGPFTVESLSPHRTLGVDENEELIDPRKKLEREGGDLSAGGGFLKMVLENLKTAGVQQASKADKITFTSITPYPGEWIGAEGRYVEQGTEQRRDEETQGKPEKRAGVFIGPEFGTVSRQDLVVAAREAADADFDVLIACAFNYEAHASELGKLGGLPILKARMNADLHMAEDLKNTGKGNLFVIFGEPDITLLPPEDAPEDAELGDFNAIRVRVNGVDVFDPSTGGVRSDDADGIACWLIDTDYNEESFFVRHAYFLGASDPYKSLKTTLKAEIDKEAWQTLHSDTSREFPKPKSGRIAVKVINHLGDEVMKVFRVE